MSRRTSIASMKPRVILPDANVTIVDELFVPGTRVWNEQLVRQSFVSFDAEEILKIIPGSRLSEDVVAWAYERRGPLFFAFSINGSEGGTNAAGKRTRCRPRPNSDTMVWVILWKLDVPCRQRFAFSSGEW